MEKEYRLTTKFGETIKKVKASSLELAIELFSKIKRLEPKDLLKTFKVEEVE
jgi:hypothetical protein